MDVTWVITSMSEASKQSVFELIERDFIREHNKLRAERENRDVCAICFEELTGKIATLDACGHQYHFECIREAFDREFTKCPLCKQLVTTISYKDDGEKKSLIVDPLERMLQEMAANTVN